MLEKVRAWVSSHNYIMFLGVRALNLFRAVPKMTLFAAPRGTPTSTQLPSHNSSTSRTRENSRTPSKANTRRSSCTSSSQISGRNLSKGRQEESNVS